MKIYRHLYTVCLAAAALAGCEPLEDNSWVNNSHVYLDWKYAEQETGLRPVELDSLQVFYYSQSDNLPDFVFPMDENIGEFEVQTNCYDVVVAHTSPFYHRNERFKSTTVKLPTRVNHMAELVVSQNPEEMMYLGVMPGVMVNWDVRRNIYVTMTRILKKINFVVTITDTDELLHPCTGDISGMATEKKIWNGECDPDSEAIQAFTLTKHGRNLNTDKFLTAYKGSVYCLGAVGRNVLCLTYYDAAGRERSGRYDLTPYLANWNTDEVTLRINIDATTNEVSLQGYEIGDTTEYVFSFE